MTATNLKDALRRYFSPDQATAYTWPCEMHEQPLQRSLDAGCIARAYWHGRQEDDDEPAAVEKMLRESGLSVSPGGFGWCEITFSGRFASGKLTVNLSMTRGQVRRLLAGLGVEIPK